MPPRRALILANPIAGGGRARVVAPRLCDALHQRGLEAELRFSERAGHLRQLAADASGERWDLLVSVGGDGSLNELLNGMADPTRPLAILPLGTGNVLACELGLPRDVEAVADAIAAGSTSAMAIGLVAERRFLLFAGVGLDGAMVERLEQVRRGPLGKWRWIRPVLGVVRRLPRHRITISTDRGERREGLSEALVTRVRSYGGVFQLPDGISAADGDLHVVCFRQTTRWQWLRAAFRAWRGSLRVGVDCELLRARRVTVEAAADVPFHVDGDACGRGAAVIGLLPEPARIVIPAPARGPVSSPS